MTDSNNSTSQSRMADAEEMHVYSSHSIQREVIQKRRKLHTSSASPQQRASQRGNEIFRADGEILFCRACNVAVDHSKQSVLDRHKLSESHKNNLKKPIGKNQTTLLTSFNITNGARLENASLISHWVRACAASNIPLNASDNPIMREFFRERVKSNVPPNELSGYRILARDYSFEPSENEDSLEGFAREMQQIKDFWASCSTQLPNLSKLALTYAFVLCSSASVERCFTYYNKLLED